MDSGVAMRTYANDAGIKDPAVLIAGPAGSMIGRTLGAP
jgi:hypothetical protein